MADLTDILFNEDEKLNDEELKKYLEGGLREDEKHQLEKKAADSAFVTDALEGLQKFKNNSNLDDYVKQLNKNLQQQITTYKQRKEKRKLKDNRWMIIAFIIILGLCILAYIVIHLYSQSSSSRLWP